MPEAIPLWNNRQIKSDQKPPSITPYLLEGDTPRPAILVIPGGGYRNVCESTEGYAIARRFNELGFHAAVLHYRVFPHHFPEPQQDAFRAIKILRETQGNGRSSPTKSQHAGSPQEDTSQPPQEHSKTKTSTQRTRIGTTTSTSTQTQS